MKKFLTIISFLALTLSMEAVTVNQVTGVFKGDLNIGGTNYAGKEIYILPGAAQNSITFVLPDFQYGAASLGDIVLVNMPMDGNGQLTLDNRSLYIKAISERAVVSVLNGFKDGSVTYNSVVSSSKADILLSIAAPSLPEPIFVLFSGNKVTNRNYAITNGGFEGSWSNNEVSGWHSFPSATGSYSSFVTGNTEQFQRSTEKRPGSAGSQCVVVRSNLVLSAKANGNCTNGRINAGATSADSPANNYNFSDPSNSGYNTAFVGQPDSLVFWAKYIPADQNPSNSANKARAHVAITTNARYQDPETGNSSSVKVADAAINYSATSSMGWQRLSTPFSYTSLDPAQAAYMLITFTTNYQPGGGTTYSTGTFSKKYYYDYLYLDDVEMIYNHSLKSLKMNGKTVSFANNAAQREEPYSDSDYDFQATADGKGAKSFVGYDEANNKVLVYVVANNYSQAGAYSVYTIQMAEPVKPIVNTEYAYSAVTCENEPYSDNLFSGLTEAGVYTTTIPNAQGGDSLITFTLNTLPVYLTAEQREMKMDESLEWHGKKYVYPAPGVYHDTVRMQTVAGCDSVLTLELTVTPVNFFATETATACQGEETEWHGRTLPTGKPGTFVVTDSLLSIYNTDSVFQLQLTVLPSWQSVEKKYVNEAHLTWRGQTIQDLPQATEPYLFYDSLKTISGCDSVYVLMLYVAETQVTHGTYEAVICEGESVTYNGERYNGAFEGEVRISTPNMYGGDSIVHLTVRTLPSYTIEDSLTITQGEKQTWESWSLSSMPVGKTTLYASYYTVDDCDSTLVLHLTVEPKPIHTGIFETETDDRHCARKVLYNGRLYIIRKDETIYDILGTKIK